MFADLNASDWFVISQLKSNIVPTTFYPFLDRIIAERKFMEGRDPNDFDNDDGLNRGNLKQMYTDIYYFS